MIFLFKLTIFTLISLNLTQISRNTLLSNYSPDKLLTSSNIEQVVSVRKQLKYSREQMLQIATVTKHDKAGLLVPL